MKEKLKESKYMATFYNGQRSGVSNIIIDAKDEDDAIHKAYQMPQSDKYSNVTVQKYEDGKKKFNCTLNGTYFLNGKDAGWRRGQIILFANADNDSQYRRWLNRNAIGKYINGYADKFQQLWDNGIAKEKLFFNKPKAEGQDFRIDSIEGIYYIGGSEDGIRTINEKLIQSPSKDAFSKNVSMEIKAGKPQKQAVAIAYDIQRKNMKKKKLKESIGEHVDAYISSKKGFYVGDICYALDRDIYDSVWGGADYKDGEYEVKDGLKFAVGGTAYGDGEYYDLKGNTYSVDAGVIGIVPLELATKYDIDMLDRLGQVFYTPGTAHFDAQNGQFAIELPRNGGLVAIDTNYEEEDIDDWEVDEDEVEELDDADESFLFGPLDTIVQAGKKLFGNTNESCGKKLKEWVEPDFLPQNEFIYMNDLEEIGEDIDDSVIAWLEDMYDYKVEAVSWDYDDDGDIVVTDIEWGEDLTDNGINESIQTDNLKASIVSLENEIEEEKGYIVDIINNMQGQELVNGLGYAIIVDKFDKWDSIKTLPNYELIPFIMATDAEDPSYTSSMPFVDKSVAKFGFNLGSAFTQHFNTIQKDTKKIAELKGALNYRANRPDNTGSKYNLDEYGHSVDLDRWLKALAIAEAVDENPTITRNNYEHWAVVCNSSNAFGESYPVFINGAAACRFIAENTGGDVQTAGKAADKLYDAAEAHYKHKPFFGGFRWDYANPDEIKQAIKDRFGVDVDAKSEKAEESLNEAKREIEIPLASDLIEVNLFNEGWMSGDPWFKLADHLDTKYIGENGDIINSKYYSRPLQAEFDGDGENQIIKLHLLEQDDAANAQDIVNKLGLTGKFSDTRKKDGYNYIYAIYIPNRLYDMSAAEFIKEQHISPELFKYPKKIEKHLSWGH